MSDMHYLTWLGEAHKILKPNVYFEIGTETGVSLALASCESFAVDPAFRVVTDVVGKKPGLHTYRGTSDDFFDEGILERLERRIDFAFLDGMHLFEYLLRDFINSEANASANAVFALHDCVPTSHLMAARNWDKAATKQWTGDVWKMIPILRRYRPDLDVEVIDAAPTGLVVVRRLDPTSRVLRANYDRIVAEYGPMTLEGFGREELLRLADLKDARTPLAPAKAKATPKVVKRTSNPLIAIKICAADEKKQMRKGDYFFAHGLKRAFEALGLPARIDPWTAWAAAPGADEIDLFLSGTARYTPSPDRPSLFWLVYPKKAFVPTELGAFAHVFVASESYRPELEAHVGKERISTLLQAFDPEVMGHRQVKMTGDVVYVANNHYGDSRRMMEWALAADLPIKAWGKGWEEPAAHYVVDSFLPNDQVPVVYSGAGAVLCDHHGKMRNMGFLSNRVYDALACGAPVIVDVDEAMVPKDFRPFVYFATDGASLSNCVAQALAEKPARRKARRAFGEAMVADHSLERRAKDALAVMANLGLVAPNISNISIGKGA
jgi:hypothetical protein